MAQRTSEIPRADIFSVTTFAKGCCVRVRKYRPVRSSSMTIGEASKKAVAWVVHPPPLR